MRELAHVSQREPQPSVLKSTLRAETHPWLVAAASTTAALAATFVITEGLAYKASQSSSRSAARGRDLDLDMQLRLQSHSEEARGRAELLRRVSDVCLAGSVAFTGATLLIWLTSKSKRAEQNSKTLIGPLVLRGANGGGLVLREKF